MAVTPGEHDRLLLFTQAELARARRARGLRLNIPEARALVADAICEWARDGLTLDEARDRARGLLARADVLDGVPEAIGPVQVEARFDDGTRLVVIDPVIADGDEAVASSDQPVSRATGQLELANEADTPIGITSHIHLAEVNPRLRLDRAAAFGHRLAIASGETVWLQPGERRTLPIAPIAGERVIVGTTGLVDGRLDDPTVRERALRSLRECGYLDIVDGTPHGTIAEADGAISRVIEQRDGNPS